MEVIRRVTVTKNGAVLVNLSRFLPKEWRYVKIEFVAHGESEIVIRFSRVV